jgi:hypothetical protein
MEAAIIGEIVQYIHGERTYADVSNAYVDYGDQSFSNILFDCPVRHWFACLLFPLTDVTELISVLIVAAAALLVCYFNVYSFKPIEA